ncbi:hypothetical protein ACFWPH_28670 [Nocardia sp. NPDC058499]|uniref:hypothetical protein n=1 Tax=Nocardia sp. NPDC058499 TaxID=3346530 RepID=UPI00366355E4
MTDTADVTVTDPSQGEGSEQHGPRLRLVPTAATDVGPEFDDRAAEFLAAADAAADEFAAFADAENTTRTYRWAQDRFVRWCADAGQQALPTSPRTVIRFLSAVAADPRQPAPVSTLRVLLAGIARAHADAGYPDPTADASVKRVMRGVRRVRGRAGITPDRAPAATLPVIQALVPHIHSHASTWRQQVAARRDIALIVLLYGAALRRSEAVGLHLSDLAAAPAPEGGHRLRIRLRGSKGDLDANEIYLGRGTTDALWCPWCALLRWLDVLTVHDSAARTALRQAAVDPAAVTDARSIAVQRMLRRDTSDPHEHRCTGGWPTPHRDDAERPVFRPVSHGGLPHADTALSGRSVGSILADRSIAAGVGELRGHSPRAGAATQLFDDDVPAEKVATKLRHKLVSTSLVYDRKRDQRTADIDTGL